MAGRFDHPARGMVSCPAAPLIAELAQELGFRVRIADLRASAAGESVAHTMSYLDHDGRSMGVGVAIGIADEPAAVLARELIEGWSSAVRTRRVLVAASETRVGSGEAAPAVAARVLDFVRRGDTVLVIGSVGPAEAVAACAGRAAVRVVAPDQAFPVEGIDPDRVSYVVAPDTPVEDAAEVVKVLRHRFPRLRGPHPREFGYEASDRREALWSVAAAADVLLVCGPEGESAGEELLGWARVTACPSHRVGRLADLRVEWLAGAATVGLAVSGPAGTSVAEDVMTVLAGLGPLAVLHRRVVTEPYRQFRTTRNGTDTIVFHDVAFHAALARDTSAALCVTERAGG
ncbi:hypothetical protein B0293_28785 [Amycolatopsis azurea DSM 43854]|uniref:4-hydroxy-3-methylbut-2-enyl diphosphate reductase n=1 Tax=Amycolatopsis azurea DSM 43854 TaxID=1238180 RepID=A0ABX3J6S4_9PSEU|nr:hypothetical protein B0293_28785 [Amycolatopsis azurea DSM 43854]